MIKGTKASVISNVLEKIPNEELLKVKEASLDMSPSMDWIIRENFLNAKKVTDRFHAQKLVTEALQDMRVELRWKAIEEETKNKSQVMIYANGDTKRQLLARSRYLLFKTENKWTDSQKERAEILFQEYPKLKTGYHLSLMFRSIYEHSKTREEAKEKLDQWYEKVKEKDLKTFVLVSKSIKTYEGTILNFFPERSTNALAECFNSKIKSFRSLVRGVSDKKFFLFRLAKIYA